MSQRYIIDADSFTAAVAQLVHQFRLQNKGIGQFKATCHDGSTVTIKVGKGPILKEAKRGPQHAPEVLGSSDCVWDLAYAGPCGAPAAPGHRLCVPHAKLACVGCGEPAIRDCAHAGQFVCGYPICKACVHDDKTGRHVRLNTEGQA